MDDDLLFDFFLSDDVTRVAAAVAATRSRSHGPVTSPETFNRRTGLPECRGLHCARIFGPIEDDRCICGRLSTPASRGQRCDRCGVECDAARLRDVRWGHVDTPVALLHPRLAPEVAARLGCSTDDLIAVLKHGKRLSPDGAIAPRDPEAVDEFGESGPAWLQAQLRARRHDPDAWMFTRVPVPPPRWRGTRHDPIDGGFARLVNRAQRLRRLLELNAPEIILVNEARMVQESFEALYEVTREELRVLQNPPPRAPQDDRARALLAAVRERPGDDDAREAYAEFLARHGDPQGEFICLQLDRAGDGRRRRTSKRERDLLRRGYARWLAPLTDAVDGAYFERGFLARCKTRRAAARPWIGDPAWATVERLETDLIELITHPVTRALREVVVSWRAFLRLLEQPCAIAKIRAATVRVGGVAPRGWQALARPDALPNLRELTVVVRPRHQQEDWSWLRGAALLEQLEALTLASELGEVERLPLRDWQRALSELPRLEELTFDRGQGALVIALRRVHGGVHDLAVHLSRGFIERVAMAGDDDMARNTERALLELDPAPLRAVTVKSAARWWSPALHAMGDALRERFGGRLSLPRVD